MAHVQTGPDQHEWKDPRECIAAGQPAHLPLRQLDRDAPTADLMLEGERRPDRWRALWPYLYRFYDADRQPLYLGISSCYATRLDAHRRTAAWWPLAEFIAVSVYPTYEEVEEAERAALRAERPRFNRRGVRGPAYARLHIHGSAEEAAALLFADADAEFVRELAALLAAPERFPQPLPPPPARLATE